jgi:hypothetical protein
MADHLICPTCQTIIEPGERCPAERGNGYLRCMETVGHGGYHWSDPGRGDGGVPIWFGPYVKHSCAGRLELDRWCRKPPGHEGAHNDGRGTSWTPWLPDDEPVPSSL